VTRPARPAFAIASLLALVLLGTVPARAQEPPERFFYHHYDYGTEALFNPLWVFVNRGFDVLQNHVTTRNVFAIPYGSNARNVLENLAHPFARISDEGWGAFVTQEVLPLSFGTHTARWVPNYALHLIGGGTTSTALTEWFSDRDVPLPRLFAALTVMSAGFVNETLENKGVRGRNTDAIADLYVFDLGALLLFSFQPINRFFSSVVVVADWSLQPGITAPRGELHNVGNYFAAKWSLPFYPRLRLFAYFGEVTAGGLSLRLDDEHSVSVAAGGVVTRQINPSTSRLETTVGFAPTGAVFLDRRESLLASLQVSDLPDYFIHLNVYPHAIVRRGPALGGWLVIDKHGRPAAGVSLALLLGMGAGASALPVTATVTR